MSFIYTKGQDSALSKLAKFIGTDPRSYGLPYFLLNGSAGTGKTTIMSEVPNMLKHGRCVGTAPTHKAVGVLAKRLPPEMETRTIHSFLGLKPAYKDGEETLVRHNRYDPDAYADVRTVLIDEDSMLDSILMKYVKEDAETYRRHYVLVGDQYQLPPVKEKTSPCFDLGLPDDQREELTEIVRQAADNPIIQTATKIRDAIISKNEPKIVGGRGPDGYGVFLLKRQDWFNRLGRTVLHETFKSDPDFCRAIGYTNDTVLGHIQTIRGMLGGDTSIPFQPGDVVLANEAWIVEDDVVFNTGDEYKIKALQEYEHPFYPELTGWEVFLEDFAGMPVYVLDLRRCRDAYKKRLDKLKSEAKGGSGWRPFYALKEHFADLRPVYALTSHKSQGSTFQHVFVDLPDIYSNRVKSEADRSLYVAVTRAAKNAFIIY